MAFLDKFNDWYIRAIPEAETGPVITWREPLAGTRYRWNQQRSFYPFLMAGMFFFMLFMPSKRSGDSPPFAIRLVIATVLTGIYAAAIWYFKDSGEPIVLSSARVLIGGGRHPRRLEFHDARLAMEERDGHPVLIITKPSAPPERIYLDPVRVGEVRELLTKAGRLIA
jgi:hypothetical protein